jgi:hypothetical protein
MAMIMIIMILQYFIQKPPGAESLETEPFFTLFEYWPLSVILTQTKTTRLPMTSDLPNCQTKH